MKYYEIRSAKTHLRYEHGITLKELAGKEEYGLDCSEYIDEISELPLNGIWEKENFAYKVKRTN